jgi:hypothetical protein
MGRSFPLDILVSGFRSSSKKGCTKASLAVGRDWGLYCKTCVIRSIASGGVRDRNTYMSYVNSLSLVGDQPTEMSGPLPPLFCFPFLFQLLPLRMDVV